MPTDLPELIVTDAGEWRCWLEDFGAESTGVWLVLAKKGTTVPTSVTYDEALDEALCQGWIDGQVGRRDTTTYRQRFTPRRPRGAWSQRNTEHIRRLSAEGRMRPAGIQAVESAQADGRWEAAYAGAATIQIPDDLAAALEAEPAALAFFERLDGTNRYAVLYRLATAKRAETRSRRLEQFVQMLARGEAFYPLRDRRGSTSSQSGSEPR